MREMREGPLSQILLVQRAGPGERAIVRILESVAYHCESCGDALEGITRALIQKFDLVLLDGEAAGNDLVSICKALKIKLPGTPVMVLLGRTEEQRGLAALEAGADDYLLRPFEPRELLIRIAARLRQPAESPEGNTANYRITTQAVTGQSYRIGELEIDARRMRIYKRGQLLELTAREYNLVHLLAVEAGKPFYREELLELIWGVENQAYAPNVSVFVSRLRRKLEDDPLDPLYLLTVRGVGYRFAEEHELPEQMRSPEVGSSLNQNKEYGTDL